MSLAAFDRANDTLDPGALSPTPPQAGQHDQLSADRAAPPTPSLGCAAAKYPQRAQVGSDSTRMLPFLVFR